MDLTSASAKSSLFWRLTIALALITTVVFIRVKDCEFVNYDDDQYATSSLVKGGLSWNSVKVAFTTTRLRLWQPLTMISFMADYTFLGGNASEMHLVNLAVHVANVVLMFALLNCLTEDLLRSFIAAAIFSLHPLRVESVAWVAERKDVCSVFFAILCVLAYVEYAKRQRVWALLASLASLALSLMFKPMFVTMPGLLLLLDWHPLKRFGGEQSTSRRLLEKLPYAALCIAAVAMTMFVNLPTSATGNAARHYGKNWFIDYPASFRASNAVVSCVRYLWKMVDVRHLATPYPMPPSWPMWQVGACAILLVAITAAAVVLRKSMPWLLVGWLWYVGTLFPVLGIATQVGQYSMADRYTYFPMVGILMMTIWSLPSRWFDGTRPLKPTIAAMSVVIVVLIAATYGQIGYWQNCISLFEHAVKCTEDNPQAQMNLAWATLYAGRFEEANEHAKEVLRMRPGARDASAISGMALNEMHNPAAAIEIYREALREYPDDDEILVELGKTLSRRNIRAEARDCYKKAIGINPQNADAHKGLGFDAASRGDFNTAVDQFDQCVKLAPKDAEAASLLSQALKERNRRNGIGGAPN